MAILGEKGSDFLFGYEKRPRFGRSRIEVWTLIVQGLDSGEAIGLKMGCSAFITLLCIWCINCVCMVHFMAVFPQKREFHAIALISS